MQRLGTHPITYLASCGVIRRKHRRDRITHSVSPVAPVGVTVVFGPVSKWGAMQRAGQSQLARLFGALKDMVLESGTPETSGNPALEPVLALDQSPRNFWQWDNQGSVSRR